jgi:hypothetical protein
MGSVSQKPERYEKKHTQNRIEKVLTSLGKNRDGAQIRYKRRSQRACPLQGQIIQPGKKKQKYQGSRQQAYGG